jgi:cytochrome c peroxidase
MKISKAYVLSFTVACSILACENKESKKEDGAKAVATAPLGATTAKIAEGPEVVIDRALLVQFSKLPDTFASAENPVTKEKAELGRTLYFDARLSKNQDVSCSSCHGLDTYGVDNKRVSDGHRKQKSRRNAPTVYNAAGHFVQFWEGRAKDVEAQAKLQLLNSAEMGMPSEKAVVAVLASMPGYVEAFKKAFPADKNPVTIDNYARAVGAFERTLVLTSRFDRYVAGDEDAINSAEKSGLKKYLDLNCNSCHAGALIGAAEYKKLGSVKPWINTDDLGRYDVTKAEQDKQLFKVASLRNVEKTAPYYHDGSVATLEEAVKLMANYQLGKIITDEEAKSVVQFLNTLTGEPTAEMQRKPVLPESTTKTPKPDPK